MDDAPTALDWINLLVMGVLAVGALFYAWRSYALQKIVTTPAGLQFLIAALNRQPPMNEAATHVALGVYARGPGARYNTTMAIWGDVDARNFSDSRTVWSAEDDPLSCEVVIKPHDLDKHVYFGVVWESPSFWRRRFIGHGYRIRISKGTYEEPIQADHFEVWMDSVRTGGKGKWKYMPNRTKGGDHTNDSTAGCSASSATLNDQLQRITEGRHWPNYPI